MTLIGMSRRRGLAGLLMLAGWLASSWSFAAYPEQPVKMIVAYSAGGGTDLVARLLAQTLQTVVFHQWS